MLILTTLLASLSIVSANLATVYWPVFSPTESTPWIQGQTNLISWETGGGTGVEVFDIQLHNINETIMHGFLPIALRVPMEKKGRRGNWGGSLSVELGTEVTAGYVSLFGHQMRVLTEKTWICLDVYADPPWTSLLEGTSSHTFYIKQVVGLIR